MNEDLLMIAFTGAVVITIPVVVFGAVAWILEWADRKREKNWRERE